VTIRRFLSGLALTGPLLLLAAGCSDSSSSGPAPAAPAGDMKIGKDKGRSVPAPPAIQPVSK